jgi:predicted CxxxxCH...CXXCH cytochrome family protein
MKTLRFSSWVMPLLLAALLSSCSTDRTGTIYQTHPTGWDDPANVNFHGNYASCGTCHQVDYATAAGSANCRACHATVSATVSCIICHGTPPENDTGLPRGYAAGAFGAHAKHAKYACTECHGGFAFGSPTHMDIPPAELDLTRGTIAHIAPFTTPRFTMSGVASGGNGTCSNTYCHSDANGGPPHNNSTLNWVGGHIACGDCHTIPPALPHQQGDIVAHCHDCHSNVDPTSDYGNPLTGIRFLNDTMHVNGRRDL